MNIVAIPSQERCRKKRTILGECRRNAGMDRWRWLETALQKSTHQSGSNVRKKKEIIILCRAPPKQGAWGSYHLFPALRTALHLSIQENSSEIS
jgi:hypothetical protein